jgi:ribosomal protein L20A (L18A)
LHCATQSSEEEVQQVVEATADSLYGVVLMKRIRAALEGLRGGLLPSPLALDLVPKAHHANLARLLRGKIKSRVSDHLKDVDIDALVDNEREALDREWSHPEKRLQLALGEEILTVVFCHFGSRYKKSRDAVRIANHMRAEEISPEIQQLLTKAVALTPKG